jgi:transposase
MIIPGIDAHKRTHTAVVIDEQGRSLASKTVMTTTADHLALLRWAERFGDQRRWAVEDCRHLSRRLERDLLEAGESIVRVPPKLMAKVRDSARTFGKSDPIDALAVARAALRESDLPAARLDGPEREVRLLADHREALVAERTRVINRLRWHLHELDPGWEPGPRTLDRISAYDKIERRIAGADGLVARLARALTTQLRGLTLEINALSQEITILVSQLAPALLAIPRLRCTDRGEDRGRERRNRPVQIQGRLRPAQRNRPAAGLVGQPCTAPAQPHRQPAAQRRDPPDRAHPGALAPASQSHDGAAQSRRRQRRRGPTHP